MSGPRSSTAIDYYYYLFFIFFDKSRSPEEENAGNNGVFKITGMPGAIVYIGGTYSAPI